MPLNYEVKECEETDVKVVKFPYLLPKGYRYVYSDEVEESFEFRRLLKLYFSGTKWLINGYFNDETSPGYSIGCREPEMFEI
mmetsp:Transcript_5268/g.8900  ORF Transcript_5268/g.8900 Transcript_5268/m.8900 type:complete len:82 (-) Transcript_5268:138-383(-)|eukprot:CAMPEP_0168608970 /NCGR_PEP_ID=MMETSP0449_2-20121227/940_1 /TAXON_ID=1082188 /ORGANISM="Strombidium rassoulzadegani, Strain ras09" /LENGTH=81 /DNA_ID=CAMNT_0008649049 /DNA_START=657 /DNA_END=902 /DNA_ORIENTATION=+